MHTSTASEFGLDIGGTKIMGVAVDGEGRPVHRLKAPTPPGSDGVLEGMLTVLERLADEVGSPAAIGIGLPGLVDRGGVLRYGPNVPGVIDLDVADTIAARHGVPVLVENDAACAAMAEHRLGAARGHRHALVITQGTGIGGGLVVDGKLVRGANGFAAEPGHMVVDPAGHRCACGANGCWETVASGAGLVNLTRALVSEGRGGGIVARSGGGPDGLRGEDVVAALVDGDRDAIEVIDRFAWWVSRGLANLVSLLDPGVIVLGGGLAEISDRFIDQVAERMPSMVMGGRHRPPVPVVAAVFGPEAGAVGAANLAAEALY